MNLTWHIIKKDLTRLRLPLLLWLALLAGQSLVSIRLLSAQSADMNWYTETGMLFNVLLAVTLVVGFLLASALVLSDPLVGADMFWVTRPISGARLLRAKLGAALLIFGLVPVLAWVPWWIYCDFGAAEIAGAAWRVLWVQAIAVIPAMVLASLVGQSGRFVLCSVLVGVAVLVGVMNFVTWGGFHALSSRLLETRLLLAAGLVVLFGAAVIWRQYTGRRFGASVPVLIAGTVLAFAVMVGWPWTLARMWPDRSPPVPGSEPVSVEIRDSYLSSITTQGEPESEAVTIRVWCKGLPDDSSVAGGLANVRLQWPGGFTIARDDLWLGPDWHNEYGSGRDLALSKAFGVSLRNEGQYQWDPETQAKRAELLLASKEQSEKSGRHWWRPESPSGETVLKVTVAVTPEVAARMRTDPPACSISVRLALQKPEVLFEMPWQKGIQMARHGARLHLLGIAPYSRGQYLPPEQQGRAYLATAVCATAPSLGSLHLYKVDRGHGTIQFLGESQIFTALPVAANLQALYFDFSGPRLWRTDKWVDVPGWLESSALAAVAYRDAGGFNRELHTDRLTVRGENE